MIDISFIVCSYNYPEISKCLDSILRQKYKGKIEILIVDGGSNEETLRVIKNYAKRFKNVKILNNKEKLPEGYGKGKWFGWKKAKGNFVAIVDQDNELQGENWINEMLMPFKEDIFGCACKLVVNKEDSLTNQYIALQGTDPFLAYKSLDGIINLKKIGEDKGNYIIFEINKRNLIITGGNCFVYRKKDLDKVGGYIQDTDNIVRLVNSGKNKIAIPKNAGTHHLAVKSFIDFIRKKKKWAKTYRPAGNFSYIPRTREERKDLIINLFLISTIIPNFFIAIKKIAETGEKAWILHPILTFITEFIYFFYAFVRL